MGQLLTAHHAWLVFFGAFLLGETLILPAAALAAQGLFSPWAVAGWAYLGTVASDALWFCLARPVDRYLAKDRGKPRRYAKVLAWIDQRFGAHPERALLFIKFIYGTRIATIVYLSLRRLRLRRFLAFNSAGAAIWIAVVVYGGWLAGKGATFLVPGLARSERIIAVVLVLVLVFRGIATWISKRTLPG